MASLKLIDELLEKTEYIYVLGIDGKPQMPTNRKVRVRRLFKLGEGFLSLVGQRLLTRCRLPYSSYIRTNRYYSQSQ